MEVGSAIMLKILPRTRVETEYIPFQGGLDTETPMLQVPPGHVRDSVNIYQGVNGGYHTFPGYERFDGQAKPSDASYWLLLSVSITGSLAVDDVLTDDTAAAYGTVLAFTETQVVLGKVTGTFAAGNIKVGAVTVGTCSGSPTQAIDSEGDDELHAYYTSLAADLVREDVGDVGDSSASGDVLGIWYYDGTWYAFRNNAGGTAETMWKSSGSGWTPVSLGRELSFTSGGTYEVLEGHVITGATSGSTATITRVVLTSGTWAGGDAAGKFIFASQSDPFEAENLDVGGNTNVATIAGDSSAITLANPSGRFEFENHNFYGSTDTRRMYGVDGVNRGFEFDGSTFVPVDTGMATDAPSHLAVFQEQLFYSFLGSVQHAAPGTPYIWDAKLGATEIAMGDNVTGFVPQIGSETGGAMTIFTRETFGTLYGTGKTDWQLVHKKKSNAGAIEYTAQHIGHTYSLDDMGILKLATTDRYGNFADAVVSQKIKSWLLTKRTQVTASCIVRDKNQYWLFFADKTALCCTVSGGEIVAMMPMNFGHKVTCVCSAEDGSGNEVVMFGSDDGYVYEMYKGTSFDGDTVDWYADFSFDHLKRPAQRKRFRKGTFEVKGSGFGRFSFSYELEYGTGDIVQPMTQTGETELRADRWDSFTWDNFYWDGRDLEPKHFRMYGSGTNISLKLFGSGTYNSALEFSGALIKFTPTKEIM
jgi:hypothetical protein